MSCVFSETMTVSVLPQPIIQSVESDFNNGMHRVFFRSDATEFTVTDIETGQQLDDPVPCTTCMDALDWMLEVPLTNQGILIEARFPGVDCPVQVIVLPPDPTSACDGLGLTQISTVQDRYVRCEGDRFPTLEVSPADSW